MAGMRAFQHLKAATAIHIAPNARNAAIRTAEMAWRNMFVLSLQLERFLAPAASKIFFDFFFFHFVFLRY